MVGVKPPERLAANLTGTGAIIFETQFVPPFVPPTSKPYRPTYSAERIEMFTKWRLGRLKNAFVTMIGV